MHVGKQMPHTTSQSLSDQQLRRVEGSRLHLPAIIQRHFGRLPPGVKPLLTLSLSVRLNRRKQSALLSEPHLIDRHPLQQLRRPCASSCLPKAAHLVVKQCWQCFRVLKTVSCVLACASRALRFQGLWVVAKKGMVTTLTHCRKRHSAYGFWAPFENCVLAIPFAEAAFNCALGRLG